MRLILLPAFLLAGCVDYGQMHTDMNRGLSALEGESIELAIDRLGLPDATTPLGDTTVYTWANDNVFITGEPNEQPLACRVKIRAAANGTILSGDYDGNQGACLRLRDKLAG